MIYLFVQLFLYTFTNIPLSPEPIGQIQITSDSEVSINAKSVQKNKEGFYIFNPITRYPGIYTLKSGSNEWEIYWEPQKSLEIKINQDEVSFTGDLVIENEYLLSEKELNEHLVKYLNTNWYSLHRKSKKDYLQQIDSIKLVYINKMKNTPQINPTFRGLNQASVNFAFDRMILRYPGFHQNFTGESVTVSDEFVESSQKNIDSPQYLTLESYQRYAKTWLDLEVDKVYQKNSNPEVYNGQVKTEVALALILRTFKSQNLRDHWSFEYVKSHISQHTWRNGEKLFEKIYARSKSSSVKNDMLAYKKGILAKRKELKTFVYKTVNNFELEAYIFKPKDFDPSKKYPTLAAFHGGGWIVGDASFTIESAQHAAENGLMAFSVEYRLSNRDDVTPEEAMQDTRDFIRWLRKHADSLSINPDQIIAKGLSAGGHLVSSISVLQEDKASVPNALILISPALDTGDGYFKSLLHEGQNASNLSPLENLKKGLIMPTTLLLQGRTDNLTPTKFAVGFHSKMKALGYSSELVIYENCGHLFTPSHLDDTGWPQSDPEIVKKAFLKQAEFYRELGYVSK